MSNLTEIEIFDCMAENLRLAAQHCDELAVRSLRGPVYENLRDALELIEGCCRQASAHREDTRWLPIGNLMGEAHKKAGDWLRGYKIDGEWVHLAPGELNQNFVKLAENLRALLKKVEELQKSRTGRTGMITPKVKMPFMREAGSHVYPVAMPKVTPGGIIIPEGARLH